MATFDVIQTLVFFEKFKPEKVVFPKSEQQQ